MEIKILELMERLEAIVEDKKEVMFTSNVMVNKAEFLDILAEMKNELPASLNQANIIYQERDKIKKDAENRAGELIADAEKEAERIIDDAMSEASQLVEKHVITEKAKERKAEILQDADDEAKQMITQASSQSTKIISDTHDFVEAKIIKLEKTIEKAKKDSAIMKEEIIKHTDAMFYTLETNLNNQYDQVLANRTAFEGFRAENGEKEN